MKKKKPYWEMNGDELAEATKEFDDPKFRPKAVKTSAADRAQLRRWQQKRATAKASLTLSMDRTLIAQTDIYAANHGITFSDVVADALRKLMQRKSA